VVARDRLPPAALLGERPAAADIIDFLGPAHGGSLPATGSPERGMLGPRSLVVN
jgi:hypothetical protein